MTDKELTKQILNLAGYDIIFGERIYTILKDGKKVQSGTTKITPERAMMFIKLKSFHEGIDKGKEMMREDFRKLLGI